MQRHIVRTMRCVSLSVALMALAPLHAIAAADITAPKTFASPAEAMRALVAALRKDDQPALIVILGPGSDDLVSSGDPVQDAGERKRVANAAMEHTRLETLASGAVTAHLGKDDWPFPIPLVKDGAEWRFDTAAGHQEVLNRRIGRNELRTLATCRAYVQAQREYASRDRTGAGVGVYAQKVRSDAGKRDGLYWEDSTGSHASPLGPLVAEADAEGYGPHESGEPQPYHGYVYRILTAQGAHAPGGARNYLRDGKMIGGFALVAYPAQYGSSGIMTFVVGPEGIVYQKNLGEKTGETAKAMADYDPDDSWTPVRD
ncbi:MAG: DUF2950 domain-containing protein [Deltaproteobacteria bacterium]|nr:MAG: DUF2950 domain-containing protein [Deltaproteobacteria bacterium]